MKQAQSKKKVRKNEGKLKVISKKKICDRCHKLILPNEKCVLLRTYRDIETEKMQSEFWYHIKCWVDFFNECVIAKLRVSEKMAFNVIKNNPIMQNLMKNAGVLQI